MTFVLISSYAPSFLNFRKELIKSIIAKGHDVVLLAPDFDSYSKSVLKNMGAKTSDIELIRSGTNLIREIKSFLSVYKAISSISPDIVMTYTIKPVIYGSFAAYLCKVPKICSLITGLGHSFLSKSFKGRLLNLLVRNLYSISLSINYSVLFQNKDDRKLFLDLKIIKDIEKTHVVNGSGVNVDYYHQTQLPDSAVFLLIARLIKEKGILEFIEASNRLCYKYPNVQFNIVGGFDDQPTSLNQKDLDVLTYSSNIKFTGAVEDVRKNIAEASIFVLPSYREGTPRSVLEAMSMGRPIITTDVPGCRETVVHGYNGFLVQSYDSVSLEKAMEELIINSNLRSLMGKRSREIALKKYDVRKVNKVILEILEL